jgi:histidinol phosphatase-like PHP family hydrolase
MLRVIRAAVKNQVAIEINNRYQIPSEKFIKLAKKEGAKFAFGTNNTDSNMGDLDWCLKMKKKCRLEASDMFKAEKVNR